MNHTFPTFQHLIDRAIMTERKCKEMEDRKRKISGPQPGSSNRLVSRAIHLSSSDRTNTHLSSSSLRSSTLSTSSRIARTISQEEVSSRGRISRPLIFLPQQPNRTLKQHQFKAEAEHASTVESKAIGDAMSEEGSPAAIRPWRPSKAKCVSAWSKQPLLTTLQPWETEPLGG
jgi:hypothetical protein